MSEIVSKKIEGGQWFEVRENDEFVGFSASSLSGDELVIDSIHVIPGARKKGIGGMLLDSMKNWGKEQGATELTGDFFPENRGGDAEEEVKRFYKNRGIEIDSQGKLRGRI